MNLKTLLLAALVVSAAGCQTQSYLIGGKGGGTPTVNTMQPFFVSGLGQTQAEDASSACGGANNVARIETQQTFLNGFLSVLSQGIYTPRQIRVYCK